MLFGPHAQDGEHWDGDVHFLVTEPVVKDRVKEWERLRRALDNIHLLVDIIVLDEALATRRAKVPGTVVYHALRDGRVL